MRIELNKCYLYGYILTISLSFFKFGYTIGSFAFLSDSRDNKVKTYEFFAIYITGISLVSGIVISSYFASYYAHSARRRLLQISGYLSILACGITITYFHESTLWIGYFIHGLSLGLITMIVATFVKELAPYEVSGFAVGILEYMTVIGITMALLFCSFDMIFSDHLWRLIWGLPIIVAILQLILLQYKFTYDTPRYYYFNHQLELAENILRILYKLDTEVLYRMNELKTLYNKVEGKKDISWKELGSITYKRAFVIGTGINLLRPLSGMYLYLFMFDFFTTHLDSDIRANAIMGIGLELLLISTLIILIIDRVGRRPIYIIGTSIIIISLILNATFYLMGEKRQYAHVSVIFVHFLGIGMILFNLVYVAEILSAKGIALSNIINWLIVLIISAIFYLPSIGFKGIGISFICLAALLVYILIVIILYAIETVNKNELEIRYLFVENKNYIVFNKSFLKKIGQDKKKKGKYVSVHFENDMMANQRINDLSEDFLLNKRELFESKSSSFFA